LSRLTFRQTVGTDPARLWDRLSGGSITGLWIALREPKKENSKPGAQTEPEVREVLRIGPVSVEVTGVWAERVPSERSLLLLDGPRGLRIAEEIRLERMAAGTELSLTMDFSFGSGALGDWLDRIWISGWVSRRIRRSLSKLQLEFPLHEEEVGPHMDDSVSFHRPDDRLWGVDQRRSFGGTRSPWQPPDSDSTG